MTGPTSRFDDGNPVFRYIEVAPEEAQKLYLIHSQKPKPPHRFVWEYRYFLADEEEMMGIVWRYNDDVTFSYTLLEREDNKFASFLTRVGFTDVQSAINSLLTNMRIAFYDTYDPLPNCE